MYVQIKLHTSSRISYAIFLTENWTDLVLEIFLLKNKNTCKLIIIADIWSVGFRFWIWSHWKRQTVWNLNVFFLMGQWASNFMTIKSVFYTEAIDLKLILIQISIGPGIYIRLCQNARWLMERNEAVGTDFSRNHSKLCWIKCFFLYCCPIKFCWETERFKIDTGIKWHKISIFIGKWTH